MDSRDGAGAWCLAASVRPRDALHARKPTCQPPLPPRLYRPSIHRLSPPQVLPRCTSNHAVDDTWTAHLSPADTTSARRLDSYQDNVTLDSVTCRARHLASRILARDSMFHRTILLFIGLFWPVFVRSLIISFILGPPLVPSLFLFYPSHRTPDITTPAPPLLAVCRRV